MAEKAVIIGGTSGIGLATAKYFVSSGYSVVIAGRDRQKLEEAIKVSGAGEGYTVDATSEEQLQAFYRQTGLFNHLILAHSGGKGGGPFRTVSLNDLRQGFEAKFFSHLLAAQLGLNHLLPGGSLTFVTAVSSQAANPGTSGLAAINGAMECMIPTLAVELAPIRVNGVSPGVIETPWWNWVPPEERAATFAQFAAASLAGRVGQPEDVAQAIWTLAANTFITGQVLTVDGGLKFRR